ncbi:hypothetical protein GN244_ATG08178 [Phytophthora infestans]|uniref:Ankyrin repeat protein n=1 Tax=Phytophthora infestans TaxID=4787 RepID=A0A833SY02_PHYIN|nr:hypothetical protein GN244_ATG08178 [Phytophthora infestans]
MLASVELVSRWYSLDERVGVIIMEFIKFSPSLSLDIACTFDSTVFLDVIWARSNPPLALVDNVSWSINNHLRSDPCYYHYQLSKSLQVAAARGNLAVVKWLCCHFSGCTAPPSVVNIAAKNGHLQILQLLLSSCKSSRLQTSNGMDELCQEMSLCTCSTTCTRFAHSNRVHWGNEFDGCSIRRSMKFNGNQRVRIIEHFLRIGDFELVDLLLPSDGSTCELDYDRLCPGPDLIEWMLASG